MFDGLSSVYLVIHISYAEQETKAERVRLCSDWLVSPPIEKRRFLRMKKKFYLDGPNMEVTHSYIRWNRVIVKSEVD